MTRSRRSAKAAGSRFERVVADYLAAALDDRSIDRRVKRGSRDTGDIAGVKCRGKRLVIEVKDCARTDLSGWISQSHRSAGNDDALCGLVVSKRKGTGDPGSQWVFMELRDLVALLTGEQQEGRYE